MVAEIAVGLRGWGSQWDGGIVRRGRGFFISVLKKGDFFENISGDMRLY